jgi:predicted ABC-type ATPase
VPGKGPAAAPGAAPQAGQGNLPKGGKAPPKGKVPVANAATKVTVKEAIRVSRIARGLVENNNCGTGKGGFQPGNKCAKGSGVPPHQSDIVKRIEEVYPPANPEANQSHARHMTQGDPNNPRRGDFTVARAALHDDIIEEITGSAPPAPEGERIYTMMGGGPASGKSSIIKAGLAEIPEGVVGDSDHIKTMLPEYNPLVESGDVGAASYVHEESSYLVKQVARTAFENGQNFTLDGTGNSSYNSVKAKVEAAKEAGYKAEGIYVTCSTEEAVRRNIERAAKTGRLPPEQMLRDTHANVSRVVPQALKDGIFDKFELYDTEVHTNGKPTLVVSARGKEVTIHRNDLYTAFVKKGEK